MACYFGCQTGRNRLAHLLFYVFAISCSGCFIGWIAVLSECFAEAVEKPKCSEFFNSTASNDLNLTNWERIKPENPEQAIAATCESIGLTPGTAMYADCTFCLTEIFTCSLVNWPLLMAALCLVGMSFLPCFYMCCFSSPRPSWTYSMPDPREK